MDRIIKTIREEGAAVLGEGIADNAADIDVVMINGYGFPRHRGGPMHMMSVETRRVRTVA